MTRRDTIIIAVLVNLGIQIILFMTSLKPSSEPFVANLPTSKEKEAAAEVSFPEHKSKLGQIDEAIANFQKQEKAPAQPIVEKEQPKLSPLAAETAAQKVVPEEKKVTAKTEEPAALVPVVVKQGDVLEKIAKAHQTTVEEVMRINRLPNSFLKIGQVLYIPSGQSGSMPKKASAPFIELKEEKNHFYTVKNGDNPWTIAVKNHIKVEELLKLNQLDEESARKLKPGDRLRIK